jgi:hypothetical protein
MKMMSSTTKQYLKRTTNHARAKGAAAISVFLIGAPLATCAGQFNASTSTIQARINSPPAFHSATDLSLGATDRGSAADLDGRWYHDGAPTRILVAPDGRSITIVNESGQSSDGYAADSRNLAIPSLGITGKVSKDGRRIIWTNGTEWKRESSMPGPVPSANISGRWFRNGQPTSIDVARDGRNFTIVQEWGLRANGRVTGNGELVVPAWKVTGRVTQNGQRIKWSNGTEWTRPRLF